MPREPRDRPWVVVFVLLSLLAHLLFVVAIVLVGHFVPPPKLAREPQPPAEVSLTLQAPPPPRPAPKPIFMPTEEDQTAKPHQSIIESDHDSNLHSKSNIARLPDSILPDVNSQHQHATSLSDAPNAPSTTPPKPANPSKTQQDEKGQQQQTAKIKPPPKPQQNDKPSETTSLNKSPNQYKQPAKAQQVQQFNPNGLPVLPALNAPTMAPADQRASPQATYASTPDIAQDVHGALGTHGNNSPDAMATLFGKYKAKVYRAVGSYWYPKVDNQFQLMPAGVVHIQFTIHDDGSVETKVLSGNDASLQILLSVSLNSIREAAPFDAFTPELEKEIAREQHNDGRSYTDDFSFSIYGN